MAKVHYWELSNYNGGELIGRWFELDNVDHDEHRDEVQEWLEELSETHREEGKLADDCSDYEEVIIGDVEDVPSEMRDEWSIYKSFFDFKDIVENSQLDAAVFEAGQSLGIPLEDVEDAYYGTFEDDTALAHHEVEETGLLVDVRDTVSRYFDYESYGRDLAINAFNSFNGHYFLTTY